MTDLVLTEKFSVASDFAKALGVKTKSEGCFLNQDFIITWAVGHLVTLFEPEDYDKAMKKWSLDTLPLIPQSFEYKPIKQSYKQFQIIKALLLKQNFERIIIATDAGREGEVIARTILMKAGFLDKTRILRFWTSQALVPEVVRTAMANLKPITDYDRLWRAGYYRQVSDWLIGMNCTRVLTVRLKDLFSVGRVQTAVLALLADRKKDREQFTPEPYWILKATFSNDKGEWTGTWFRGKETRLTKQGDAQALYQHLAQTTEPGEVLTVKKEEKTELPPFLFSLTDLQQEANRRFGFSAKKTLNLAQALYQDKKCLSYPRTDSRVMGTQNLEMVEKILETLERTYPGLFIGINPAQVSLSNKRVFNDAKLTDHHALIPFKPVPPSANADEKKIFELVLRRFVAAFHPPCRFENTRVVTSLNKETFQTLGKVILSKGWHQVFQVSVQDKETAEPLPPLAPGDKALVKKIDLNEKKTIPPPDYTDSLLLKDMTNPGRYVTKEAAKKIFRGDIGIGTQSTRAQIIETLISRNYVVRAGKQLIATEKGVYLVDLLRKCPVSSVLTSPEETARWEMNLNNIALGNQDNSQFLTRIKTFVSQSVDELKSTPFDIKEFKTETVVVGNCPDCNNEIRETPKTYACSNRECQFIIWKKMAGKTISAKMATNLLKYRRSGPFNGFRSKNKKQFSAFLVIKEEHGKHQVAFDFEKSGAGQDVEAGSGSRLLSGEESKTKSEIPADLLTLACPVCAGRIIEGKKGVGCSNWRPEQGNCRFVIWKEILGKKLTIKNIETLLAGKTTIPYVFRNRNENKFKAKLRMIKDPGFFIEILPMEGETVSRSRVSCTR